MVRIRKNATLSPLLFCSHASPEDLHPHVCQLNQSPWESSNPCFHDSSWNQFEVDDCFYGNTSLGDSIKDNESVSSPSMMDIDNKPNAAAPNVDGSVDDMLRCQKHDGKSWRCKNPVKKGFQVCDHHFKLIRRRCLRYYEYSDDEGNKDNNNGPTTRNGIANSLPSKKAFVPEKPPRRGRPPKAKKGAAAASSSSNNPYEFYYYSGFKPRLSTRRGVNEDRRGINEDKRGVNEEQEEEEEEKIDATENVATSSTITSTSIPSQKIENGEVQFDYIEDDFYDDDEDEDDEGGRKRMRKPVKARSLKSLM